ncbi:MAG: glycosyltransferase [Ignavibacteria bacterium]|nr:glycosyltransferase [Ignavibacteria bacterium]
MKILYLANELRYTCGVTNHLLHLTQGISSLEGYEVYVICGGGNGLNRFDNLKVNIMADERFLHEKRNIRNFISAVFFLINFIKKENIQIVHSHYHYGANIASLASKFSYVHTVQTNHGIIRTKGLLKHFNADKYVAINEHILDYLTDNMIAEKNNIYFIRCGIPVIYELQPKPEGKLKFLVASRLVKEKGVDIFIKAAGRLDKTIRKHAEFLIAGEGPEEDVLKRMSYEYGADVRFLGRVEDVYKLLSEIHVLVYPSRSDTEGFPAIITEAGATCTLVISSDFYGSSSLLNESNSLIFKSEDPDELREILSDVIIDYNKHKFRAENLHKLMKREFNTKLMIEKHVELYESIRNK